MLNSKVKLIVAHLCPVPSVSNAFQDQIVQLTLKFQLAYTLVKAKFKLELLSPSAKFYSVYNGGSSAFFFFLWKWYTQTKARHKK